ncbi:MAG: putative toxin-antitoxin system toxin component, PIN family [Thermodesulfovibrionales bacterium]
MRVILDTNVFVSGVFFAGPPYQILEAWRDRKLKLIISQEIIDEYLRVGKILSDQFPTIDLLPLIELVNVEADIYPSHTLPEPVCDDPDDDKFLACALAGKCKLIVSGDKHLLKVSGFKGVDVIKPREFVDKYLI